MKIHRQLIAISLCGIWGLLLVQCISVAKPPPSNRLQPDHAPTPFSAQEIRQACPSGHKVVHRIEQAGEAPQIRTTVFVDSTASGTTIEAKTTDVNGNLLGEPQQTTAKWEELQAHASFPAKATKIMEEICQTPSGKLDCWKYTVKNVDGSEQQFWFAKQLPGPPVLFETYQEGKRIYRMELVAN